MTAAVALAAAVIGALSACQSSNPPEDEANAGGTPETEHVIQLSEAELAFIRSGHVSAETERAIGDGVVSFSEYESAFLAMVRCFEDNGVPLKGEPVLDISLHYVYSLSYSQARASEVQSAAADCKNQHFEAVSRAWGAFVPPDLEQKMREARVWASACMRERGVDVETDPSHERMIELLVSGEPAFNDCVLAAQQRFNLGPVIP